MLNSVPECLSGLRGDQRLAAPAHRSRYHHRQFLLLCSMAVLVEHLADGDQRRLGVQRVEDRLHQKKVNPARDQGPNLVLVGSLYLIECDHPKAGVVGIRRI
jgi:hypothetical protein